MSLWQRSLKTKDERKPETWLLLRANSAEQKDRSISLVAILPAMLAWEELRRFERVGHPHQV